MRKPMNLETAKAAIALYSELASHDNKLRAMTSKAYDGTPLQKVCFYMQTATFSGPTDYTPRHKAEAIARNIVIDMKIERQKIAAHLVELGFDVPAFAPND